MASLAGGMSWVGLLRVCNSHGGPGAPLKAVILRASYLSPNGTAAGEASTIETKCFARAGATSSTG